MQKILSSARLALLPIAIAMLHGTLHMHAFPPAPYHVIYGQIRDEYGNPLTSSAGEVILDSSSSVQISGRISDRLPPGTNYRVAIPMDAGLLEEAYRPTALNPSVPFKLKVRLGQKVYLPIEMKADFTKLGQPGQRTRIDLTLGEDSDGDGLPDAWEKTMLAMLSGNKTLADIQPNADTDKDGLSNLNEYLAGTYAFDPKDGFSLSIVRNQANAPLLEFTVIKGRTYTILGSEDLKQWDPISFRIHNAKAGQETQDSVTAYRATDVRPLQVVPSDKLVNGQVPKFFRLMAD